MPFSSLKKFLASPVETLNFVEVPSHKSGGVERKRPRSGRFYCLLPEFGFQLVIHISQNNQTKVPL